MGTKSVTIGAFEAKTRLSELLRETERGRHFVILRRGRPVARLMPAADRLRTAGMGELVKEFRDIRGRVRGRVNVRRLIAAGRRV